MSGKGSTRQERPARAQNRHANEKANQPSPAHDGDDEEGPSLSQLVKLIESFRAETRGSLGTLQSTIDTFGTRLTEVEASLQDCDDRITALEAKCEQLANCNKLLMAKSEDLESRSRRQNLRVVGVPENMEGPQVTAFMTDFFAETLGMEIPDGPEMLDRAHRLAFRPASGPRPMIVTVHHFRVKQRILQLAREKGPLTFRGHAVHIFPDFTAEVAKRRASFTNIKQKLRAADIKYGLLFPARLQISFNGGKYSFATAEEAVSFYAESIVPTLRADRENDATG